MFSPFPFCTGYVLDYVSVTLVLCLMMVLQILSFSLTFSNFLSIARWLLSSFSTNALVRDHVWHPYVIAGKTHWLKTFLFRLVGRCLSRKISQYLPKTLHPAFILIEKPMSITGKFLSEMGKTQVNCQSYDVSLTCHATPILAISRPDNPSATAAISRHLAP